jgi:hypothetical protein
VGGASGVFIPCRPLLFAHVLNWPDPGCSMYQSTSSTEAAAAAAAPRSLRNNAGSSRSPHPSLRC